MTRRQARGSARITRIEILIAASIVALVAGITVPRQEGSPESAETRSILHLVERLTEAVRAYHEDTGRWPTDGASPEAPQHLTEAAGVHGWSGPYLPVPLRRGDHPFGGALDLHGGLEAGGANADGGFRLGGTGRALARGPGAVLALTRVPPAIALLVDRAHDAEVTGLWSHSGRVEYDPTRDEGTLLILLERPSSGL